MKNQISIFLVISIAVSLSVLLSPARSEGKKNIVIIYSSRYGSTAQNAKWIAEGLEGKAKVVAVNDAGDLSGYEKVILGSGIYNGQLHQDMSAFLEQRKDEIKDKIVALFVTCGSPPDYAQRYLDMFAEKCGIKLELMKAFPGWQKKELLSPEDYKTLESYYKSINKPFEDYDNTNKAKCLEWAQEILKAISKA